MYNEGYFVPITDIIETSDSVIILVELPGLTNHHDNIIMELSEGLLEIKGEIKTTIFDEKQTFISSERTIGRFKKTIPINQNISDQNIKAKLEHGILCIEIQKIKSKCSLNKQKIHIL